MNILQYDNGSEFKGVFLELIKSFGVRVINGRSQTPRTQGLVEQANRTVKTRINAWKRTHGSSHWSESLDVSYSIYDSTLSVPRFLLDLDPRLKCYHDCLVIFVNKDLDNRRPKAFREIAIVRCR